MEEIKEFMHDRVVYALVGINTFLDYIGIENLQRSILWFFTILLLLIKIRIHLMNMKARRDECKLNLEIKKEELKLSKQKNLSEEQKNFYSKFTDEFIKDK